MTVASLRLARTRQGMSRAAVTGARTLNRTDSERGRPVPFGDDGSRSGGAGRLVSPRLRRFDSCGPLSGQVMVQAAHAEPADSRPNASNVALHGRACTGVRPHVDRRKVGRVPTLPHHLQQGGLERLQRRPHKPVEACSTHAPAISTTGSPLRQRFRSPLPWGHTSARKTGVQRLRNQGRVSRTRARSCPSQPGKTRGELRSPTDRPDLKLTELRD